MSALDRRVAVTFFRDFVASTKTEELYTPRALAERIRVVTASSKSKLPLLKLARFGNVRTNLRPHPDGSGRMTGGSLRHDTNLLAISGIEADYDAERLPFGDVLETLEKRGLAALAYTSPSHRPGAPRWRVLCPLSVELPASQRRQMLGRLNGLFGGVFSRESWTLSQSYYFGSVQHSAAHQVELVDGTPLDEHDDLDESWIGPGNEESLSRTDTAAVGDEREIAELVRRALTGEEIHTTLLPLAARLIGSSVPRSAVAEILRGILLAWPETSRNERWQMRFAEIGRLVDSAAAKFGAATERRRESGRVLARLACRLIRQNVPDIEVLKLVDEANAKLECPVSAEDVGRIAIWAAGREGRARAA